jgi:cytochrome c oxidase subunit 3
MGRDARGGHMETTEMTGEDAGNHEHASRWPLIAAVGAAGLYAGVGAAFVGLDLVPAVVPVLFGGVGAVGLVVGLAGWAHEAFVAGATDHADLYTGGMVLFLLSDVATFAAGFVYYAFVRVGTWPPGELPPLVGSLVAVNTLLLVASSVTVHYAHEALAEGERGRFLGLLAATVGLGVVFLGGQAYEYYEFIVHEGFTLSSGVFASAFFGLTGLHGLHVSLGVVLLAVTLGRALRGRYSADRDTAVRTTALYWHFVDGVWLFLVAVLYVGAVV